MQPMPAAVTAWRKILSFTSPAANTPGDFGCGRIRLGHDVAALVEGELAFEHLGDRIVADCDENAVASEIAGLAGFDVHEPHAGDVAGRFVAQHFVDDAVPNHRDLRVREQPLLQNCSERSLSRR